MTSKQQDDDDFKEFWNRYNYKLDKIAARRAWNRLSAKDRKAAMEGIDTYREACRRQGINMMYPQGYITHRRWEDEDVAPQGTPSFSGRPFSGGNSKQVPTSTSAFSGTEKW